MDFGHHSKLISTLAFPITLLIVQALAVVMVIHVNSGSRWLPASHDAAPALSESVTPESLSVKHPMFICRSDREKSAEVDDYGHILWTDTPARLADQTAECLEARVQGRMTCTVGFSFIGTLSGAISYEICLRPSGKVIYLGISPTDKDQEFYSRLASLVSLPEDRP